MVGFRRSDTNLSVVNFNFQLLTGNIPVNSMLPALIMRSLVPERKEVQSIINCDLLNGLDNSAASWGPSRFGWSLFLIMIFSVPFPGSSHFQVHFFVEAPLAVCVSTFLFVDLLTWELGQVFLLQFYREPLRRFNCSSGTIEKNELQSR